METNIIIILACVGIAIGIKKIQESIIKKYPEIINHFDSKKEFAYLNLPLLTLVLCFSLYYMCDVFMDDYIMALDKFRYASTYTPYLGSSVDAAVRFAQEMGYMSDELVERSPEMETAIMHNGIAKIVSYISFVLCALWIYGIKQLIWDDKDRRGLIKFSSTTTFVALTIGFYYVFPSQEKYLFVISSIFIVLPLAFSIYKYNKAYKKLCRFLGWV